jgi:hypothetical protein
MQERVRSDPPSPANAVRSSSSPVCRYGLLSLNNAGTLLENFNQFDQVLLLRHLHVFLLNYFASRRSLNVPPSLSGY